MNRPTTTARSWLAPAIALLFLAGLVAPSVTAGPLGTPAPAPTGAAVNLLTLKADGSIVAWLDAGSNRTTIHIQGVQAGAGGFNLADPYGRLVGPDQSSNGAGFVDFVNQKLLKGTYTILGPTATSPASILGRANLAAFGATAVPAFVSNLDATASAHRASTLANLCNQSSTTRAELPGLHAWAQRVDASCVVGLDGATGCLLDAQTYCFGALAWAWALTNCGPDNTICVSPPPPPQNPRGEDCNDPNSSSPTCQALHLAETGIDTALSLVGSAPALVTCAQNINECLSSILAGCTDDRRFYVATLCQLVALVQDDTGGGGGSGGVGTCQVALVACGAPDSTLGTDPWAGGSYTTIRRNAYYSVDGTVTMFGRIDQLVSESDPNYDYYAISNYLKQEEKADFSNAYLTTYFGQNAPTYPEELDWSPGFSQVSRPTDFGLSLGAGGASFNVGWTQSWSGNWEITDRWSPQTQGDFAYYAHRDHFNPDASGNPWNTLAQGNLWRVTQGTTLDVLFEGQIHVGWWPFDRTEYSGLQSFYTWNSTCGSSPPVGLGGIQDLCLSPSVIVPNPPVPAGPGA